MPIQIYFPFENVSSTWNGTSPTMVVEMDYSMTSSWLISASSETRIKSSFSASNSNTLFNDRWSMRSSDTTLLKSNSVSLFLEISGVSLLQLSSEVGKPENSCWVTSVIVLQLHSSKHFLQQEIIQYSSGHW